MSYILGNRCPQGKGPKYLILNIVISREMSCFGKEDPHQTVTRVSHVGRKKGKFKKKQNQSLFQNHLEQCHAELEPSLAALPFG